MRRLLPIILLFVFATVCLSGCRDVETRRTLRRMMGSTVVLPEKVTCVQNGEVFPMPEELRSRPKLIVFVDSTECSSCQLGNVIQYREIYEMSVDSKVFDFMLLVSTSKMMHDDIIKLAIKLSSAIPIYFDTENFFKQMNPFITDDDRYHSFTVDKTNQIVLVGNPINESTMNLFQYVLPF